MTEPQTPLMRLEVITIFPDYLAPLSLSLVGKAIASGLVGLGVHDLRDWTHDRHRTVDDTPYGGGAGMVMKPEPWGEALDAVLGDDVEGTTLVVPTPSGVPYTQALAIIESVVRLLPGVVGNPESLVEESHSPDLDGLLEYPVFTKPLEWRGLAMPDVLVSGHHARISAWRREQAERLTSGRVPPVA